MKRDEIKGMRLEASGDLDRASEIELNLKVHEVTEKYGLTELHTDHFVLS